MQNWALAKSAATARKSSCPSCEWMDDFHRNRSGILAMVLPACLHAQRNLRPLGDFFSAAVSHLPFLLDWNQSISSSDLLFSFVSPHFCGSTPCQVDNKVGKHLRVFLCIFFSSKITLEWTKADDVTQLAYVLVVGVTSSECQAQELHALRQCKNYLNCAKPWDMMCLLLTSCQRGGVKVEVKYGKQQNF